MRNRRNLPPLSMEQILTWADAYHQRTGKWPTLKSGPIPEAPGEKWSAVASALLAGVRGLPKGPSLAQTLATHRGAPHQGQLPSMTTQLILSWADDHYQRTGKWPNVTHGPIAAAPGETWRGVQMALLQGLRGLPGGSSLARLLSEHRNVINMKARPPLTQELILSWVDAHHKRTGEWPSAQCGPIIDADGEKWSNVDSSLKGGNRGLPGGSSLATLLAQHRGVRNHKALPHLTPALILSWADEHHHRTGNWPKSASGPVVAAPGETWSGIESAFLVGGRGLQNGWSLARLLAEHRNVRNLGALTPLTEQLVLSWADEHHKRTGKWPSRNSGPIPGAEGESWSIVANAIFKGIRGLPGGSSLANLLEKHRGVPKRQNR